MSGHKSAFLARFDRGLKYPQNTLNRVADAIQHDSRLALFARVGGDARIPTTRGLSNLDEAIWEMGFVSSRPIGATSEHVLCAGRGTADRVKRP